MKTALIVTALVAAFGTTSALADANLAKAKKCNECHAADKEVKGPAYKAIAKLYKGTPNAAAQVAAKIKKGGAEHWGSNVMPTPEARGASISDADSQKLARWILAH